MLTEAQIDSLEKLVNQWNQHPYFRFYFMFKNHLYQLNILEKTKDDNFSSGIVTEKIKRGAYRYSGYFTSLSQALDFKYLEYFFNKYVLPDMEVLDEVSEDVQGVTERKYTEVNIINQLGFNPTTTFVIKEQQYTQAVTIATKTNFSESKPNRNIIVDTLTNNGFWVAVKDVRILGKKQRTLNRKLALKPIYQAMLNPTVMSYDEVLCKIKQLPESEIKTLMLEGLSHKWDCKVVVVDWKGN